MLFQFNRSGKNYSLLLEIYNKYKKKNSRQKQIDSSTNTKRKKRKEKKNVLAQQRSSHIFFLIFPFSYSSHCTARVEMCLSAFARCLNKEEDPVERSRYECSTQLY